MADMEDNGGGNAFLALGMPDLSPISSYAEAHKEIVSEVSRTAPSQLIASISGLMTMPEWQASAVRLEVLQHLAVSRASGTKKVKSTQLKVWLTELGQGAAGSKEDPSEDVFVSRVLFDKQNFIIYQGLFESSAFQLQRFLNVLERMPDQDPYSSIKRSVASLLLLSNEVAKRAGVAPFQEEEVLPLSSIPNRLLSNLSGVASRVIFTLADLKKLSIEFDSLGPFIFSADQRDVLLGETLGHSSIERAPLVWFGEYLCLALPTAISAAVRRFVIEFCTSIKMQNALYSAYTQEHGRTFADMPLLGGNVGADIRFQRYGGLFISNVLRRIDQSRLLHICFVVDSFDGFEDFGLNGIPEPEPISNAIQHSIVQIHTEYSGKDNFKSAVSLIVLCPWGRPMAFDIDGLEDSRWRIEHISAAELESISWTVDFSPLSLWRLLDSRDRLQRMGVHLWNFNGLINLFAWSRTLNGHLVPHAQMTDEHNWEGPIQIMISQNQLLDVRKAGAEAWNLHFASKWDGEIVKVRRHEPNPYFSEDKLAPLYVSMDDLAERSLLAVYESSRTSWWVSVAMPNSKNRDFQYGLWNALALWTKRTAPVLEQAISKLRPVPILWRCEFLDDDDFEAAGKLPSSDEARSLLEIKSEQNVISVRAKKGFLRSLRHATNVAETLLVESLIRGAFALVDERVAEGDLRRMMKEVVRSEWARDIHLFTAREFRDFVRESIPTEVILISEEDAAYSCLGLGWRARSRAEGPRINGIDECCGFLGKVIDSVWEEVRAELKTYSRVPIILKLVANHEAAMLETQQWMRTSKALVSLRANKVQTEHESAMQIAKLNACSLSTRLLIEMALCECPESDGHAPGELDIARLLSSVMRMHHLGGLSEGIKYGGKVPEVRITPLGDVHTHATFDEEIMTPYGEALGVKQFRYGAREYDKNFKEVEITKSVEGLIEPEFWSAWAEAFGFTIDEMRRFIDNIEHHGMETRDFFFSCTFEELCKMEFAEKLPEEKVRAIVDALCLSPRESWESTPPGFSPKDWYPWRFRRRLSLIARPIIQLTTVDPVQYLIAPSLVRTGVAKVLEYCRNGGFDAKDFSSGKMRSWIGAAENRRGHKFNEDVSKRLVELGWRTKSNIKLTEILNDKLDKNYGDIDVLAWNANRILAIECKDLELAMTAGDVARQIYEFRGEHNLNGKPDRLKRHLERISVLKSRTSDVEKYTQTTLSGEIETHLVFSDIVPMSFSEVSKMRRIKISIFEDLQTI